MESLPADVLALAQDALGNTLPAKSAKIYKKIYEEFRDWMMKHGVNSISEMALLAYFNELSRKFNPQSLWSRYSMLTRMITENDGQNVKMYKKVASFLKQKSINVQPKTAKVFTNEQISEFLKYADDNVYLSIKVCNCD